MLAWIRQSGLAAWLVLCTLGAMAQGMSEQERNEIFTEANQAAKVGPQDIKLAGQAMLHLPTGHRYIGEPLAHRLLNAMGNPGKDDQLQGLIFPTSEANWFMTVRFEPAGYVKDDDARDWNADDLLKGYREGTEAANAERAQMGVPPLEIIGWAEKPAYDAATHRLVWAMSSRHKGAPDDEPQGVNYNTYALGREGYFSLNLVTGLNDLPTYKPTAATMLAALEYLPGKTYADFNSATDHVAEYGLAALVVGVAAKKLGFLAVALAFLAKFAKVIFIGLAASGGIFAKIFKSRKARTAATAPAAPPAEPGTPPQS
ncbi:MAG: hypothetical protein RLY71_3505 [Pseudomonadota bacterium]|jgi:uncharacterized membrane-anchored protein